MPRFTVFTPTFNRAQTLPRVWESLLRQTCRDFEWLIVDDGSRDGTADLVKGWQAVGDFPIRYLWQENQGKHAAFNRAVAEAAGQWFINLDSDDGCVPEALGRFEHHWQAIPAAERDQFAAITCLCQDQHGQLIGDRYPTDPCDTNYLELKYRWRVRGEKWSCHRTAVLREYPFPHLEGVSHVPEGIVWAQIARRYRERCVNEELRIYWQEAGSIVHSAIAPRAAAGRLEHLHVLNEELDYLTLAPAAFARSATHYARFSFHCGQGLTRQLADLRRWQAWLLWCLFWQLGWWVYLRDRWRER